LEAWHKATEGSMMRSRNAVRDMLGRCRENEIQESQSKAAALEFAKLKAEAAKKEVYGKAAAHERVIDTSFKCMQEIEDAQLQMEDSCIKLKHERMQGFAALQVCTRRMELREKRPPAENFQDYLADALNKEKAVLETARADLFNMEGEAKKIIDDLVAMRRYLSSDTGERRLEMAHDISSLKVHVAPPPPKSKGGGAAAESGAPAEGETGEGGAPAEGANEAAAPAPAPAAEAAPTEGAAPAGDKLDSKKLLEETHKLLGRSRNLRARSFDLISRVKAESRKALGKTEDAMARRTADLSTKKKNLETHALDVEAAIAVAERSLDRLQKRLDPKDTKKAEKLQADVACLDQLRKCRTTLQDDIRNKFTALEIDNLCRRVTPAKADSAKRQSAMARTASAPSLRGKKKDLNNSAGFHMTNTTELQDDQASTRAPSSMVKPGSPAGGSSSLKAAAAAGLAG